MNSLHQGYGSDYEVAIGQVRAERLMSTDGLNVPAPKIGYEVEIARSDCGDYRLFISNISGQLFVRCSNCVSSMWRGLLKFDPETLLFINQQE